MVSKDDLSTWSKTILDHGALLTDDINHNNLTHFICAYRTSELFRQIYKRGNVRIVTAHWLNDVLQRKKIFVPNLAIHYPSPFSPNESDKLPLTKYYFTMTGFEGIERARLRYMIRSLGGKYSGHLSKCHTHLLARENGKTNKFKKALEWSISIVNGLWLSELFLGNTYALKQPLEERYKRLIGTPIIDHFSFDQIFVHDLLLPWSQPIRITDEILNLSIRRHNEQQQQQNSLSNIQDIDDSIKNSFHYNRPMIEPITINNQSLSIMLSGFNIKTLNYYETIIKSLGGQISTLPHHTTHLIMNRYLRTEKFYECMNYVTYILNKNWLDKCNEEKRFLSIEESDWIFDEELKLKENLFKQSIDKRIYRKNRPLFNGYHFFLTPSIQPSQIILKSIIYSTGGYVYREFPTIKQLITINEQTKIPNCLILSCEMDKFLLKDLHKYNNTDFSIQILSIDFLLQSILHQEILNIDSFILKI
jgi:PAX-interacting protein 1